MAPNPPEVFADFAAALPELAAPFEPSLPPAVREPTMLLANDALARDLGLDPAWLGTPAALAVLGARAVLDGSTPVAQAYAGHQFGGFSPLLGDGRAALLGEVRVPSGGLRDLALKGSGRTPFSRAGDGRAVLGPVLREYLFGEAMHALGIPTTRALSAVTTGDLVARDGTLRRGAVLARVAASHLRVGTFELVARSVTAEHRDDLLSRLVTYAVQRHYPALLDAPNRAAALLDSVIGAQASLLAQWTAVGFIHGVMNTDNTTISGETIDYGPCAWLEAYDLDAVFSSIDTAGRYRFGYQAPIMVWNLSRFAETLLPLISEVPEEAVERATALLDSFAERHAADLRRLLRAKLGLTGEDPGDAQLIDDLLAGMASARADYTSTWRLLAGWLRGIRDSEIPGVQQDWLARWLSRLSSDHAGAADAMDAVNPVYVPRNHLVEAALAAADLGDLAPFERLLAAVRAPYAEVPDRPDLARPGSAEFTARHVTFCGT